MDSAINNNNRFCRLGGELALVGALTFGAFLVRLAIDPFIGDKHQFVPAYAAIAGATWLVGWRAGAFTAIACLLAGETFAPHSAVDPAIWHVAVAYTGYVGMSALVVSLAEWVRRDKEEAALAAAEMQAADRRRSDFMALLGHELRSPLATIAVGERMIKSGRLDAMALRGTAEMMERQTERMTRLVADLLDVARLRTGKLSLRPQTLDVSLLVQEAAEEVRAVAGAREQRLVVLHPSAGGIMFADPLRLHQVLVNLLRNACKFSPEHAEIELSVSGDDGWVTISVKDQGIGIAPSQLQRIFEPFVQLPAAHGEERGLGAGRHARWHRPRLQRRRRPRLGVRREAPARRAIRGARGKPGRRRAHARGAEYRPGGTATSCREADHGGGRQRRRRRDPGPVAAAERA